jgi:hypothetical protein
LCSTIPQCHRCQPLPDVPLVKRGARRDLGTGPSGHIRHDIKQPGTVAHAHHQGQRGLVQHAVHPLGEFRLLFDHADILSRRPRLDPLDAHEFITALPSGYDTPVGQHGQLLSGG